MVNFRKIAQWLTKTPVGRTQYYAPGATATWSDFGKHKVHVQAYRSGDDDLPYVQLDLSVQRHLAWCNFTIPMRLSDAREFLRLLAEVIDYFQARGKGPLPTDHCWEQPIFTRLVEWFDGAPSNCSILHSPGAIVIEREMTEYELCVQAFRPRDSLTPYTRLELSVMTYLGNNWLSVVLGLEATRELIRLVEQAVHHFDNHGSAEPLHRPGCVR